MLSDPGALLEVWMQHFKELVRSRTEELPDLKPLQDKLEIMAEWYKQNEEHLLDVQRRWLALSRG